MSDLTLTTIIRGIGCIIMVACTVAFFVGLISPKKSPQALGEMKRAERFLQKGKEAYNAKKYKTAAIYFTNAAKQDIAEAQFYLGKLYSQGEGVEMNKKEAAKWYRKAADHGIEEAMNALELLGAQ